MNGDLPGLHSLDPAITEAIIMRKRNKDIRIRMSEEEYAALQEKLVDVNTSRNTYLVGVIADKTIYPREPLERIALALEYMNRAIRGMATNLNQIAKWCNTTQSAPAVEAIVELREDLRRFNLHTQSMWDFVRRELKWLSSK